MTANLKRHDPVGADAATLAAAGTVLSQVIVAGAGTAAYEIDYGLSRGSNVGCRLVAPGAADQANVTMSTTTAAAGSVQVYGVFESMAIGGSQEFLTIRTTVGNCVRFLRSTTGSVIMQNKAGVTVATLGTIPNNVPYRYELDVTPGTTVSNGAARGRIYDDADTLVFDSGPLTANDYGGTLVPNTPSIVRCGDPSTATTSGFAFGFTQLALDTGATPPVIPPVAKITNAAPTANAGPDQIRLGGEVVQLTGLGSTDPNGDALTYAWTPPAGITLSSNTAAQPTFTAPYAMTEQTYTASLVVTDTGALSSSSDAVIITVSAHPEWYHNGTTWKAEVISYP